MYHDGDGDDADDDDDDDGDGDDALVGSRFRNDCCHICMGDKITHAFAGQECLVLGCKVMG